MITFHKIAESDALDHEGTIDDWVAFYVSPPDVRSDPDARKIDLIRFVGLEAVERTLLYSELCQACADWISERPQLASWIHVRPPIQVGEDFVAWQWERKGNTVADWLNTDEFHGDPPEEYWPLRATARFFLDRHLSIISDKEMLLRSIVSDSFYENAFQTTVVSSSRSDAVELFEISRLNIHVRHLEEWDRVKGEVYRRG